MKKNAYLAPSIEVIDIALESVIATSIKNLGGNSGIQWGTGSTPGSADGNRHRRDQWSNGWDD